MTAPAVLVTGGAGYVGSHACKALALAGFLPVTIDNLVRGHRDAVRWGPLIEADILDTAAVGAAIQRYAPVAALHFAAFAYVDESVRDPAKYYRNNVGGSLSLLTACREGGLDKIVFSSSCATYGTPDRLPIDESAPQRPISPYGRTKLIVEELLADWQRAYGLSSVSLRYFNAAGADPDGEIRERHYPETHLVPLALQTALGISGPLEIFGDDYPTPDGTCVRDYVHVSDLAQAHVAALRHLLDGGDSLAVNLGSGSGTSVLEVLAAVERTLGRKVPYVVRPRRPGDPPALYADPALARWQLGFTGGRSDIDTIVRTAAPFAGAAGLNRELPLVDTRVWRGPADVACPAGDGVLVPLFSRAERWEFAALSTAWFIGLLGFWLWWLEPGHNVGLARFLYVTIPFAWLTLLPVYFLVMLAGARAPDKSIVLPAGLKAAMVVTRAPSEPFEVVSRTLLAMLEQAYPHDTWLADEDPSPATAAWCQAHGVKLSTRRDHPEYQREDWPRRKRCKEGNLAFFYDTFGYLNYEFVVQMDADHVPSPGYLEEMLRPFADPAIGYVSAPSICDSNAGESWSARARLYAEASMHGPLQAGYAGRWAPLCIGSHYAVRTTALRSIGGLGPELAEDHSTTLMMNAHGWRGAHALEAIAHGEGPRTFTDLITQEFQWSRSLVTILLRYSPSLVGHLPPRLRFQFLFCQLWYPLHSLVWAALFAMPIVALLSRGNLVNVSYWDFAIHYVAMPILVTGMVFRWRARGWLRPGNAKVITWEGILFALAKWPWSLLGAVMAVYEWVRGSFVDFRITPKGEDRVGDVPVRVLAPYMFIAMASALAALVLGDAGTAQGFYVFAIINALFYCALLVVIIGRHRWENRNHRMPIGWWAYAKAGIVAAIVCTAGLALEFRGIEGISGITWGTGALRFTRTLYSAAGAGTERSSRTILIWPAFEDNSQQ